MNLLVSWCKNFCLRHIRAQFTAIGPQPAPAVSGFVSSALGWRWVFWIGLIFAGASFIPMMLLPETFYPAIIRKQARKERQTRWEEAAVQEVDGDELSDNSGIDTAALVRKSLLRPVQMLLFEPVCIATCVVVSYASAIYCGLSVNCF